MRLTLTEIRFSVTLSLAGVMLGKGINFTLSGPWKLSIASMLELNIGSVDPKTVFKTGLPSRGSNALLANTLMANAPQVVLSLVYFSCNALWTSMLAGLEWSKMALHRKSLRVSKDPQGKQRSTYFLELLYRYSLPLIIYSSALHWLVSQAIFLVALQERPLNRDLPDGFDIDSSDTITYSCGWSPLATLLTLIGGTLLMGATIAFGLRRYPSGMPLGATNSAVLAAVCRLSASEEEGMEQGELEWGDISPFHDEVKHCTLSSGWAPYPENDTLCYVPISCDGTRILWKEVLEQRHLQDRASASAAQCERHS